MSTTVLVSGASGFIALHTVKILLAKGYTVVGSVRSSAKGDSIKKLLNSDKFSYEIVKDIAVENAFDDFVKNHPEATVFLHTASPFTLAIEDIAKDLLAPAITGTKSALSAIKKFGPQIKRVVVTSSFVAMADFSVAPNPDIVVNEESWSSLTWETSLSNNILGYCGSKTLAEKTAWDFVEAEKPNFALSTVNPVYVFGPQAFDELVKDNLNTSSEIINGVLKLKSKEDEVPQTTGFAIDVRDVADAHIFAFEKDEAIGKRFLLSTGGFTEQTILDVLHKEFPEFSEKYPIGNPGSDKERLAGQFTVDNSWTRNVLDFKFKTVEESIRDSAAQILRSA